MTKLAIAIPTYRRAGMLVENLNKVLDEAARLGIPIYISDDSPDDETKRGLAPLAARHGHLHYRRNDPALRHDRNLIETLLWPDADYVWLLGDSLYIIPGQLERVVAFLDEQDLVFINSHANRMDTIHDVNGEAAHELLREMLWHQTLTGATIYHRRVCEWLSAHGAGMFTVKRNFPQLSVTLGYASAIPATIGWFGEQSTRSAPKKNSYWLDTAFDVFVDDWVAVVSAFPDVVPPERRAAVIRSHSANTRLFSPKFLRYLRGIGHFNRASLERPHFFDAMHLRRAHVWAVLMTPRALLSLQQRATRIANGLPKR